MSDNTDKTNHNSATHMEGSEKETRVFNEAILSEGSNYDYLVDYNLAFTLIGIAFSYLSVFIGPLLVVLGLPVIEASLPADPDGIFISICCIMGECIALLVAGRMSDIFGRRFFVLVGNALAIVGYLVAARADSVATNIGGSFLFGLGVGAQTLSIMFALELVPFNRRYLTYAYIISVWSPVMTFAAGLCFTIIATTRESWRWVNYIGMIASFVSLVLSIIFYHPPSKSDIQKDATHVESAKKIDYIGTTIWTGSTVSFLLGIDMGGQRFPWNSGRVIAPLVVGGIGWLVAAGWEFFTRSRYTSQVLPLLRKRNFVALTLCMAFVSMTWTAPSNIWAQQIVAIYGGDQILAGWADGLVLGSPVLGNMISGVAATAFSDTKSPLIVGCVLLLAFTPALSFYNSNQIAPEMIFVVAAGIGSGLVEVIAVVGAAAEANIHEYGIAVGVIWTIRRVAVRIANAVYTNLMTSKASKYMTQDVIPILVKGGLGPEAIKAFLTALTTGDTSALGSIPGVNSQMILEAGVAAKQAYVSTFKVIYLASIAFGACALVAALLVSNSRLLASKTPKIATILKDRGSWGDILSTLVFWRRG